jgi:hypothetical protein
MVAPWSVLLKILRYLKGTLFHGLHFSVTTDPLGLFECKLGWGSHDLSFDHRVFFFFFFFLLGDSFISWRSKKQTVITHSSSEAKYRALVETTAELHWLNWLLQDLGVDFSNAIMIHYDNRSVI